MTVNLNSLNASQCVEKEQQKKITLLLKQPLKYIQQNLLNLEVVFLELSRFEYNVDLVFKGKVTLILTNEFINPQGKIFAAIKGLTIQAGLIKNAGAICTNEHLTINGMLDNSQGLIKANSTAIKGKINNIDGNILIPSQAEITAYTGSVNTRGNVKVGGLLNLKGHWNNHNGILLGKLGIKGDLSFFSTEEKGIIKSTDGPVEIVTQQMSLQGFVEALKDISFTSIEQGASILRAALTTPQKIRIQSNTCKNESLGILIQETTLSALQTDIQSNISSIRLENVQMKDGRGLLIVKCPEIRIIESEFELDSVELKGKNVVSKDSSFEVYKGIQVNGDATDFSNVDIRGNEDIELISKESGYFEDCTIVSDKGSVKNWSKGELFLKKVKTIAKKIVHQKAQDLFENDSINYAGELLKQEVKKLISTNVHHFSYQDILLITSQMDAPGLTAGALGKLTITVLNIVNLRGGNFLAGIGTEITSSGSYVDITEAKIKGKRLKVLSFEQVEMQEAQIHLKGKMEVVSTRGWIAAQRAAFETKNEDASIDAPEGIIHLENNTISIQQKMIVRGKFLQVAENAVKADKGIEFHGSHIYGKLADLISKLGNIKLNSIVSIWLENVEKYAKGQISEKSQNWIYEDKNINSADKIVRESKNLALQSTQDQANIITNSAEESSQLNKYFAEAKNKISLLLGVNGAVSNSKLNSKKIEINGDSILVLHNRIKSNQLDVDAGAALIRKNLIEARLYKIYTDESSLVADNELKTKLNKLESGHELTILNNTMEGDQEFESSADMRLVGNTFKEGKQIFKGHEGDITVSHKEMKEVGNVKLSAPHGTVSLDRTRGNVESINIKASGISLKKSDVTAYDNVNLKATKKADIVDSTLKSEGTAFVDSQGSLNLQKSQIEGNEQVQVKAAVMNVAKTTLKSLSGGLNLIMERGNFDSSTLKSHEEQNVEGNDISMSNSNLSSNMNDVNITAQNLQKEKTKISAQNVTETAKKSLTSLESTTLANEMISSTTKKMFVQGGVKKAEEIVEEAKKGTYIDHAVHAKNTAQFDVKQMGMYQSVVTGSDIVMQGQTFDGSWNKMATGNTLDIEFEQTHLPQNNLQGANIQFNGKKTELSQSIITGDVFLNISSENEEKDKKKVPVVMEELGLQGVTINGNLQGENLKNVNGTNLSVVGGYVDLEAERLRLLNAKLHGNQFINLMATHETNINDANIKSNNGPVTVTSNSIQGNKSQISSQGEINIHAEGHADFKNGRLGSDQDVVVNIDSLNANESAFHGKSIYEKANKGNSSVSSIKIAKEEIVQNSGTFTDNEGSKLKANKIEQSANIGMNLQEVDQEASVNTIETSNLDVRQAKIYGLVQLESEVANAQRAKFFIDENTSQITTNHFHTDANTKVHGPGSMKMDIAKPETLKGVYTTGKTFEIETPQTIVDANIKADKAVVTSTDGNVIVKPNASIKTQTRTEVSGTQLENHGVLESQNAVKIHQDKFKEEIGDVKAGRLLNLSSNSDIVLNKISKVVSSLQLDTFGSIVTNTQMQIGGNLILNGEKDVHINNKIHVTGRGIFKTKGKTKFNRTQLYFGNGLEVRAKKFNIKTSNVDIKGKSLIDVDEFILKSEYEKGHKNSKRRHKIIQSNFRLEGDLDLNARKLAHNDASNFLVKGNMNIQGKDLTNLIRSHFHAYKVKVGKKKKRTLGIKHGSKSIYKTVHELIIDAVANTQVSQNLKLDLSGTIRNNGIILAKNISGKAGNLLNGHFNKVGQTPTEFTCEVPSLTDLPKVKTAGQFGAANNIILKIENTFHNRGFVEAGNVNAITATKYINEIPVTEETEESFKLKKFGRLGKRKHKIDVRSPGGKITGRVISHKMKDGENRGGEIEGGIHVKLEGDNFLNKEVPLRCVEHLKAGSISPLKSAKLGSDKTDFVGAKVISGGKLTMKFENKIENSASDILGVDTHVEGGEVVQTPVFASHVSRIKRKWNQSKKIHSITMKEGNIRSIGPLKVISNKKDMLIEGGEVGSNAGKLKLISKKRILFRSKTMSVKNKISKLSIGPTQVSYNTTESNTTASSIPRIYAGNGALIKANESFEAEGLQVKIKGDVELQASHVQVNGHKVEKYVKSKGFAIGAQFFGSAALNAAVSGKNPQDVVKAILQEDSALASLFKLLSSRDIGSAVGNTVISGVNIWNEVNQFARAFNQGNLLNALGQHFGITDAQGNFQPRITVSLSGFKNTVRWTELIPCIWEIQGNIKIIAPTQIYRGVQASIDGEAYLKARMITMESEVTKMCQKSESASVSVSYDGKWGFGAGYAQGKGESVTHHVSTFKVGKKFKIDADEKLKLAGAQLEGEKIEIKTHRLEAESMQDTSSSTQMSISASTTGEGSASFSHNKSKQVNNPTFIKSKTPGTITADEAELKGILTENIHHKVKKMKTEDIHNINQGFSVGASISRLPENSQGLTHIGTVEFQAQNQQGTTVTTIAGGNGNEFGVNTDPSQMHQTEKGHNIHVVAPIVAINPEALNNEFQEVKQAFTPTDPKPKMEETGSLTPFISLKVEFNHPSPQTDEEVEEPSSIEEIFDEAPIQVSSSKKTGSRKKEEYVTETVNRTQKNEPPKSRNSEKTEKNSVKSEKSSAYKNKKSENPQKAKSEFTTDIATILQRMERNNQFDHMLDTALMARVTEATGYLTDKLVEGAISGIKLACSSHPLMQAACQNIQKYTVKLFQAGVEKIPDNIKESTVQLIKDATRNYQNNLFKTIQQNELNGIHPAITKAYYKDLSIVALGSIPFLGKIKGIKKTFRLNEIIKELENVGYKVVPGGKGSHTKMTKPNSTMVIINHAKEYSRNYQKEIFKILDAEKQKIDAIQVTTKTKPVSAANSSNHHGKKFTKLSHGLLFVPAATVSNYSPSISTRSSNKGRQDSSNPINNLNLPSFPSQKHLTSEGSIEPISNFILTPAPEMIYNFGQKVIREACNTHPYVQKICRTVSDIVPEKFRKHQALVLTTNWNHNRAFDLTLLGNSEIQKQTLIFKELERNYEVTYKRIWDLNSFCRAIDDQKANGKPANLLIVRAHGHQDHIALDHFASLDTFTVFPNNSCLKNLAPKPTIVLDSCSTGQGGNNEYNFANQLLQSAPPKTTIYAPTTPTTSVALENSGENLKVSFKNYYEPDANITYKTNNVEFNNYLIELPKEPSQVSETMEESDFKGSESSQPKTKIPPTTTPKKPPRNSIVPSKGLEAKKS